MKYSQSVVDCSVNNFFVKLNKFCGQPPLHSIIFPVIYKVSESGPGREYYIRISFNLIFLPYKKGGLFFPQSQITKTRRRSIILEGVLDLIIVHHLGGMAFILIMHFLCTVGRR